MALDYTCILFQYFSKKLHICYSGFMLIFTQSIFFTVYTLQFNFVIAGHVTGNCGNCYVVFKTFIGNKFNIQHCFSTFVQL